MCLLLMDMTFFPIAPMFSATNPVDFQLPQSSQLSLKKKKKKKNDADKNEENEFFSGSCMNW